MKAPAAAFTVCLKTFRKWLERYDCDGPCGLHERSSRPANSPERNPARATRSRPRLAARGAGLCRDGAAHGPVGSDPRPSLARRAPPARAPVARYERGPLPASCCILTSRSSAASRPLATESRAILAITRAAPDGNARTCASTITRG